jgi:hypothetical protein
MTARVAKAIEGVSLERRIDSASTLTIDLRDPDYELQADDVFAQRVALYFDGLRYRFAALSKSGDGISTVFEAAAVSDMKRDKGLIVRKRGTTTRTEFAEHLVRQASPNTRFTGEKGDVNRKVLVRKRRESSWTCCQRLAEERAWRCFEDEDRIYFGSDDWLAGLGNVTEIERRDDGIIEIDYDYDGGQRSDQATITCFAHLWAARPGAPVRINGLGSLISGKLWIVESISRPDVFSRRCTVQLTRRTPELPEPKPEAPAHDDSGGGTASGSAIGPGPVSRYGFQWPTTGAITGLFGDPRPGHVHAGLDIDGETGDRIRAARGGHVTYAGEMSGYGLTVDVQHADGFSTRYAHLSSFGVSTGDLVDLSSVVGRMGSTGNSTGSHLHFEIRRNGIAVDPLTYLP